MKARDQEVAKAALAAMARRDAAELEAGKAAVSAASLGQKSLAELLGRWMAASTNEVDTADHSNLEAAVYKKTMEMIGEDATLKVCTQF